MKKIHRYFILYIIGIIASFLILYLYDFWEGPFWKKFLGLITSPFLAWLISIIPDLFRQHQSPKPLVYILNDAIFLCTNKFLYKNDAIKLVCGNEQTLSKNLILYEGTIINRSKESVRREDFEDTRPFSIHFTENYEWRYFKIKDKSPNVEIINENTGIVKDSETKSKSLQIQWKSLLPKEYIKFEAIIEYTKSCSLPQDSFNILRGIYNYTDFYDRGVKIELVNEENLIKRESTIAKIRTLVLALSLITVVSLLGYVFSERNEFYQEIITPKNDTIKIRPHIEGTSNEYYIVYSDVNNSKLDLSDIDINKSTIEKNFIAPSYPVDNTKVFLNIVLVVFITCSIQLVLMAFVRYYYIRRLEIGDFTAYPYMGDCNRVPLYYHPACIDRTDYNTPPI